MTTHDGPAAGWRWVTEPPAWWSTWRRDGFIVGASETGGEERQVYVGRWRGAFTLVMPNDEQSHATACPADVALAVLDRARRCSIG